MNKIKSLHFLTRPIHKSSTGILRIEIFFFFLEQIEQYHKTDNLSDNILNLKSKFRVKNLISEYFEF